MEFARQHGLNEVTLLLFNTPDTGDFGFIIESGGRYYFGDLMIDYLHEITKPKTFLGILRCLDEGGVKALRTSVLKKVPQKET